VPTEAKTNIRPVGRFTNENWSRLARPCMKCASVLDAITITGEVQRMTVQILDGPHKWKRVVVAREQFEAWLRLDKRIENASVPIQVSCRMRLAGAESRTTNRYHRTASAADRIQLFAASILLQVRMVGKSLGARERLSASFTALRAASFAFLWRWCVPPPFNASS
jgi:hypothetical protein